MFRAILGRLNLSLLGLAIVVATFWFTDQATNRQPAAPAIDYDAVETKRREHPSDARVFVYIIDSLRDDVGLNSAIMPNLAALCREGAYVRTHPGFNSGSAASLRDAFTGRENAAVLATVATFVHSDAGVESIFHQMALEGLTTAAYSAGFFRQFGAGITREEVVGLLTSRGQQEKHVLAAVEAMRSGEFNCVFGHVAYTDAVAHEQGVGTPVYEAAFRQADALIPVIRERLPAGTTLVVMGDHGHDLKGRHGIGLDVPTLAVYAGPRFRRGVDLGATPIMSHRYLLSQALGLPVTTEAYAGEWLPQALASDQPGVQVPAPSAQNGRAVEAWAMWIYLSLFGALWLNLVCCHASPLRFSHGRAFALWAGSVPFFLNGASQRLAMVGVLAGLVVLLAWGAAWRRVLPWLILPAAAALLAQGWGRVLVAARPALESMPLMVLVGYWIIVVVIGAALATRARRTWVMAGVFAVPALLFHPVYHAYGFPGTLAPLLGCWFVFHVTSLAREGRLVDGGARWKVAAVAAGLFLLLQCMAVSVTVAGTFDHWLALVPAWTVENAAYYVVPTLVAHALLFFPRRTAWPAAVLGMIAVVMVGMLALRWWTPDAYWRRGLMAVFLAGWGIAAWRQWRDGSRICGLAALFVMYFSFIALTPRNFLETAGMLGALALCAQMVAWFPQRENLRADYLMLALLGLMITGWAGMRWSGTHLEWHAVYEWARASVVENNVGWFIPWIALKGLVPWGIVLWLLRDRLGPAEPLPAQPLLAVFCAKALLLTMLAAGLGGSDTYNRSYLETASVMGTLIMLYLGVILLPGAWPGTVASGQPRA